MASRIDGGWKKGLALGALAVWTGYSLWNPGGVAAGPPGKQPSLDVLFSPNGGCQDRIVEEIGKAEKRIRVQIYMFTSKEIAEAVIAAKKRGVECEVILDKSQEKMVYGRMHALRRAGVPVLVDAEHETANNKIMLIDERTIITGSYNYTKAAEETNAENILVIKDHAELFSRYAANFEAHRAHSKPYQYRDDDRRQDSKPRPPRSS
jgi:phosphatidylserine/phosphatidylglycerophosphate/cardiolipin synthase-like enzyme